MGSIFMEEDEWSEVLWHLVIVIDLTQTVLAELSILLGLWD